jgi:hypothetical protein
MPRVVGDLLEALRPVVAAPGENLDAVIREMNLYPVAVEFYFMDPALAARHFVGRRRQRRFNEAGIGCLDPDRSRFLALECHPFHVSGGRVRKLFSACEF